MHLLTIYILSFVKSILMFAQFLIGLFVFLQLNINSSFCILDMSPSSGLCIINIFFQSLDYFFIFLRVYFKDQKFLNLVKSNLSFFLLLPNLRNLCLLQVLCFLFEMFRWFVFRVIIDVVEFTFTSMLFFSICSICSLFPFPPLLAFYWIN